jgi:hypothetical protein
MNNHEFLVLKSFSDKAEYEKKLYKAFIEKNKDGLWDKTYTIIDGCAYRANYPDSSLRFYCIKTNGDITAGMCINSSDEFELEKVTGFKINKKKNACEGLNFFILLEPSVEVMELIVNFMEFVINDLTVNSIPEIFITCGGREKTMYVKGGEFIELDMKDINGKPEYLLKKELG